MSLAVLLALGLLGLYLMITGQRRERRAQDVDANTLMELAAAGSDLDQPHEVEFFFYLPSEQAAQAVAETLRQDGFAIRLEAVDPGHDWLCLGSRAMTPVLGELRKLRTRFTALAETHGGAYDGWGATVVLPGPGPQPV
jgi:hypothetical protein